MWTPFAPVDAEFACYGKQINSDNNQNQASNLEVHLPGRFFSIKTVRAVAINPLLADTTAVSFILCWTRSSADLLSHVNKLSLLCQQAGLTGNARAWTHQLRPEPASGPGKSSFLVLAQSFMAQGFMLYFMSLVGSIHLT